MQQATKTEGGLSYPAEAFAYVPDKAKASSWKLRLWESPEKKATIAQLGRAAAALSPGGFRGQKVELPAEAVAAVKRRIRAEYRKLGVAREDMPASVFSAEGEEVGLSELRALVEEPEPEIEFAELTYQDRKLVLASALGIETYGVKDFTDSLVIYYDSQAEKLYGRTYGIVDGKVKLGQAELYVSRTSYEPVSSLSAFALEGAVEFSGADVIREGKVFEVGDYPDKEFALSEQEADEAIADFIPVENDLEHRDTILSGKLGKLESIVRKGKELFGRVRIPKWLHDLVGANPIKVSLGWDREKKRITGNALVLEPRIPDAQLAAAFAAANNPAGSAGSEGADMPETTTKKRSWFEKLKGAFSARALPDGMEDFDPDQVAFKDDLKPDDPVTETRKVTGTFSEDERAELAGLRAGTALAAAERFVDSAIKDCKVFPAQRDSLIALFQKAVLDDGGGRAVFGADGTLIEGERVKLLRAAIDAHPAHELVGERLAGVEGERLIVFTPSGNGDPSEDRKAELLAKSGISKKGGK